MTIRTSRLFKIIYSALLFFVFLRFLPLIVRIVARVAQAMRVFWPEVCLLVLTGWLVWFYRTRKRKFVG